MNVSSISLSTGVSEEDIIKVLNQLGLEKAMDQVRIGAGPGIYETIDSRNMRISVSAGPIVIAA